MPTWNTPSGSLPNATKGEPYQFNLSCSPNANIISFDIISGTLPNGLILNGINYAQHVFDPLVWGVPSIESPVETFPFTIRATDQNNNISDRTFSISVLEPLPEYVFPYGFLGEFPDGAWMESSLAVIPFDENLSSNIQIISGGLPANLTIDPCNGRISGFISPSVLYNSPPIYQNIEPSAPPLPASEDNALFTFVAEYNSGTQVEYSMEVVRQDIFFGQNIASYQYNFQDYVVPSGIVDGVNQIFTLPNDPFPPYNARVYYNGTLLDEGIDYTVLGNILTYIGFAPAIESIQFAFYTFL